MNRNEKIQLIKLLRSKKKRELQKSYYDFFLEAWPQIRPNDILVDNWHIRYLCDLLQKEVERIGHRKHKDKDIIINICPRSTKSLIFSVMLTPWAWTNYPYLKIINTSHSRELSTEHCMLSKILIESDWYQGLFSGCFTLSKDQNTKTYFANDKTGERRALSVESKVSGKGANIIIGDDLVDPKEALSKVKRASGIFHWQDQISSRLDNKDVDLKILVEQRTHREDVSGHELEKRPEDYNHIKIPVKLDENSMPKPAILAENYENKLFDPVRLSLKTIERTKKEMTEQGFTSQYMQNPMVEGGNMVKKSWFRFYRSVPDSCTWSMSVDATFKKTETSDHVAIGVWAKRDANRYLADVINERMGFLETIEMILQLKLKYPNVNKVLIEDKANGSAIIDTLKNKISGIIPVNPGSRDKIERLNAVLPIIQAGNIHLPLPKDAPWVGSYIEQMTIFPNTDEDDMVDMTSQYLEDTGKAEDYITSLRKMLGKE